MARPPVAPPSLADTTVSSIVAEVRGQRGVARRKLPKVAPSLRAALDAALRAAGLEVTPSVVRVPARAQLLALLAGGAAVEEKGLVRQLACVTAGEAKALVASLVREGAARRVERPSGTALSLPSERAVGAEGAARLAADLEGALKWVRRAARTAGPGRLELLESDVTALLERLGAALSSEGPLPAPSRAAGSPSTLLDRLAHAAIQLAAQHGGLAPLPTLVRALDAPTASVHAALLEGHARGLFELQPESSMGRLGAEDLALCLAGPEGTHLSWVRPLPRAHSWKGASP